MVIKSGGERRNKIARTYVANKIEVHDDGPLPEGGVVLPGGAGSPVKLSRAQLGEIRT